LPLVPLLTSLQVTNSGVASRRVAVQALVAAGDLRPEGTGHARYPAAEVQRLVDMPALEIDEPAMLVTLGPWAPEDGTVLAGRSGSGFRPGMEPTELGDSTRGLWRVTPARFFRSGLVIPVHLGITRGAYRIIGSGPIPVGDRWAVEVEPLQEGGPSSRRLAKRIIDRRATAVGRSPIRFINGA